MRWPKKLEQIHTRRLPFGCSPTRRPRSLHCTPCICTSCTSKLYTHMAMLNYAHMAVHVAMAGRRQAAVRTAYTGPRARTYVRKRLAPASKGGSAAPYDPPLDPPLRWDGSVWGNLCQRVTLELELRLQSSKVVGTHRFGWID